MMIYSYLALGDSYTIGELVEASHSFPYQTVALLNAAENNFTFHSPKIIATTGWTTDELNAAIEKAGLLDTYDIVTLLIGVNNQYRGRTTENFSIEFEGLLQKAIAFANNKPHHVIVLSIPDWGITPYAVNRPAEKIRAEIDAYNAICKNTAEQFFCHYIDITEQQRADGYKEDFLASDLLHPSRMEYSKWAQKLAERIHQIYQSP